MQVAMWNRIVYLLQQVLFSPLYAVLMLIVRAGRDMDFLWKNDEAWVSDRVPECIQPYLDFCNNSVTNFDIPCNR